MLIVKNLNVRIGDIKILNNLNIQIPQGQVHALMGQNGSGKSTLAYTIMGHPMYEITSGEILFNGKDILKLDPTQRSLEGIFLSFQQPNEITGVKISSYLRMIYNKTHSEKLNPVAFRKLLNEKMKMLDMKVEFSDRFLNEGFSGGEKKRMEMLQMLILEPKLAILDEVDSGLDVDAIKVISKSVNYLHKETNMSVLLITHYSRILKHIEPDFVHIMENGSVIKTSDKSLAFEIEDKGYETLK